MKKLFTFIFLFVSLTSHAADKVWCMVTDDGAKIAMSRIGFLLASDKSDAFNIVCNDGQVIYNVSKVLFEQAEPSGISSAVIDGGQETNIIVASSYLRIKNAKVGTAITIYDSAGRSVMESRISSEDETVSIESLPSGLFIIKADKASVKFIKK